MPFIGSVFLAGAPVQEDTSLARMYLTLGAFDPVQDAATFEPVQDAATFEPVQDAASFVPVQLLTAKRTRVYLTLPVQEPTQDVATAFEPAQLF